MSDSEGPVGVRYPFINLEKAIERAKQLYDADQRGREMTISAAFAVWEYSEKSSGGFQTIGALKMYGLLQDAGVGDSRKLQLTPDALRYFRDEREEERTKLARKFAITPKLLAALWAEWMGTPPADAVARSHLKAERGLNEQSARSLLAIYKDNLAFADLKPDVMVPEADKEPVQPKPSSFEDAFGNMFRQQQPPKPVPQEIKIMAGERELTTGLLSKEANFRLIVSGPIGVKEIERLIAKLELDKEILAENNDGTEDHLLVPKKAAP